MKNKIIFFTRVPKEGTTKTRLYEFVSPQMAVDIQKKLVKLNYNVLKNSGEEVVVYHDGESADDSTMAILLENREFSYQEGKTLGDKMYNAIEQELKTSDKVILLGSDIYNLKKDMINTAFAKLDNFDIVINPSIDGGYFLIGMKKAIKEVFDLPSYGDNSVLENLLAVCNEQKLSYYLGEAGLDIDTKEDLLLAETGYENIELLGAGEYNINFVFDDGDLKKVLRINMKSQMNLENQIEYEYETLQLLEDSGVTPKPYELVTETSLLPYKYLTMEFLKGRPLNYKTDMHIAAYLLSKVHNTPYGDNNLINAANPFQLMFDECKQMAGEYLAWDKADEKVSSYINRFLEKCLTLIPEKYNIANPCIINTELNSGNFLIGEGKEDSYVIDWEKALIGECEQDLAHFLAPTTTFWKTDIILSENEVNEFLEEYGNYRNFDRKRFERYLIFNCLRGVTWCSMAFRQYSENDKMLMDDTTAPIIYVLMFMFLPVFFFPVPILAVAGGVAFGFVEGSLLTFVGASLNCYIMFVISRRFGREWVKNYLKKKMTPKQHDRIFNVSDEKLMMSLVILRLIPLVPYNMINYGYGLTNISLTKYMIASVLGIIPGTVVFLNFGATSTNIFSKEFLIASLLVILLTVGSIYLSKLVEKREQQKKTENNKE